MSQSHINGVLIWHFFLKSLPEIIRAFQSLNLHVHQTRSESLRKIVHCGCEDDGDGIDGGHYHNGKDVNSDNVDHHHQDDHNQLVFGVR